ncbi:MAG: hypothetical protein ACRDYY_17515 [Acidimicrobiales bacterium]
MVDPFARRDAEVVAACAAVMCGLAFAGGAVARRRLPASAPLDPAQPRATNGSGPAFVVAAAGGLLWTGNANWWMLLNLALLVAGGWLLAGAGWDEPPGPTRRWVGAWALVLGAALLGFGPGGGPGPAWVDWLVVLATLVATPALGSFDRRRGPVTLPLLVLAVAGIYVTAPDTEQTLVLLGAAVGVCAVGWWLSSGLGPAWAPAVAGLVVWATAVDGRGRHAAIVGGLACLGVLVVEPAVRALRGRLVTAPAPGAVQRARRRPWPGLGRWGYLAVLGALQAGWWQLAGPPASAVPWRGQRWRCRWYWVCA